MKTAVLCVVLLSAAAQAAHLINFPMGWDYTSGAQGPANWGTTFPTCSAGQFQSPIDIDRARVLVDPALMDLTFDYKQEQHMYNLTTGLLQLLPVAASTSTLNYNGQVWTFAGVRFHAPSEHTLNGVRFPLEAEFVHTRAAGDQLSLSLLFNLGPNNNDLPITFPVPTTASPFNPAELLPADLSYMTYQGSESIPPCTQVTQRVILNRQNTLSFSQYSTLFAGIQTNQGTARPVQSVNNRTVHFHGASVSSVATPTTCTALTEFNIDTEGWSEFSVSTEKISNVTHAAGKYLTGRPIPGRNQIPWSFTAPLQFRGNISHLTDNGTLSLLHRPKPTAIRTTISGISGDVTLIGQTKELTFMFPYAPNAEFFTEYTINFGDLSGNGFRVRPIADKTNGAAPTRQDVFDVLSYVKCVTIRGTFNLDEAHVTDIDQVYLCDGNSVIRPCPGFQGGAMRDQCTRRGVCVGGVCRCDFGWEGADCSVKDKCAGNLRFPLPQPVRHFPGFASLQT